MINIAYAMAQPPTGDQPAGSPIASFLPLILIFIVFYFLLIRPQKKQAQKQQEMINSVKKGDLIVTSGGIHGKINYSNNGCKKSNSWVKSFDLTWITTTRTRTTHINQNS